MGNAMDSQDRKPITLLKPRDIRPKYSARPSDRTTGVMILSLVWTIFVLSMALLFDLITIPNGYDSDFPVGNYYTLAVLLIPVMAWLWAWIGWTAMKLFRHAAGVGGLVDSKES